MEEKLETKPDKEEHGEQKAGEKTTDVEKQVDPGEAYPDIGFEVW